MENKKMIGLSMVLLVAFLGSVGYNIMDNTYYCEERGLVMECVRFSGSGNRCYPSLATTKGYRDCKSGWIKVEKELDISTTSNDKIATNVEKYHCCDSNKCIPGKC